VLDETFRRCARTGPREPQGEFEVPSSRQAFRDDPGIRIVPSGQLRKRLVVRAPQRLERIFRDRIFRDRRLVRSLEQREKRDDAEG
jgi:hypothetical protein